MISRFSIALCLFLSAALLCPGIISPASSAQSESAPKATLRQPDQPRLVVQLGHSESITSVAFSPDGRHVLTGSGDTAACVGDRETGKEVRRFEGHARYIVSVAISPDGRYVLTGS
jgi:WD40 repeat protein